MKNRNKKQFRKGFELARILGGEQTDINLNSI